MKKEKKGEKPMASQTKQNLYEILGGKENIAKVVKDFYDRVLADDSLNFLFKNTDMDKQRAHMTAFLVFALGGPNQYSGRTIKESHEGLNITSEQFDKVAFHMIETLKSFNVAQEHIDAVIAKIAPLKEQVVTA
jgi:hemoglobin